ncbi:uncharacterized protein LOC108427547 isoform X1 [Pygocentrus nattereri]|uniref:uncharacterized protein LOC108427547 isoform X1 n=2 Tax=Pygocentrus nattereri TaxID=42514 RepID=UPI001890D820|nr:uncharacterized protein LOC108427547 isoform X1 [Pygocentrus nattereri]
MTLTEHIAQPSPQVLLVGEKDSKRLLETYVKRSLSLNDGAQSPRYRERRTHKWVTLAERDKRNHKHSSDTSIHLNASDAVVDLSKMENEAFSEPETKSKLQATGDNPEIKSKPWKKRGTLSRNDGSNASHKSDGRPKKWFLHFDKDKRDGKQPNKAYKQEIKDEALPQVPLADQLESSTEEKKPKETKKSKKSSVWKSVMGWFSRGNSDKQEEQDGEDMRPEGALTPPEASSPSTSCLPLPDVLSSGDAISLRRRSFRRRRSQRRLSLKRYSRDMGQDKATGRPLTLELCSDTMVKSIEEVEPTSAYYEKMSEELQKIVHEVKNSPSEDNRTILDAVQPTDINGLPITQEEVIERIITLIKQNGDVIDSKLKENPAISSYFMKLSYGSFQQLADQYVLSTEVPKQPPVAAPELVKFAFTLDFTARVAGLSRHAPGHILGFGNQYLKDRFSHTSESHPHITDIISEKEKKSSDKGECHNVKKN